MECLAADQCDLIREEWPTVQEYGYAKMKPSEREAFMSFYLAERRRHGDIFDTRERLLDYCIRYVHFSTQYQSMPNVDTSFQ